MFNMNFFTFSTLVNKIPGTIFSFDEVILEKNNPLVLCDIDETLLTFPKTYNHFYNDAKVIYDQLYSDLKIPQTLISREQHRESKSNSMAKLAYDAYLKSTSPQPTDHEGFKRLIRRVRMLNGKIIFVTARGVNSHEFTRKNFEQVGLDYDQFEVHFTNANPKGEYIKNNIPLDGYNEIVFIDDLDENINNVNNHLPQIQPYKFVMFIDRP